MRLSLALVLVIAGCGENSSSCPPIDKSYAPAIDPANFVDKVDNPLFPLVAGARFDYREGQNGTVEITVLAERKLILGVSCTVVHDVFKLDGEVREDTIDWYAQDRAGNVWYFGEDTKEMRAGRVTSTKGSWQAGVDGAKPGLIIPAMPTVGQRYRQEYYACQAEDFGEILELSASATVPLGSYTGCLKTRDFTPLEPEVNENKYYCPGVGLVLAVDLVTGEREELVAKNP